MNLYLTTSLDSQNSTRMNKVANWALTPYRHFMGGKTFEIIETSPVEQKVKADKTTWMKTALLAAAFFPGLIVGAIARYFALKHEPLQRDFHAALNPPPSPPSPGSSNPVIPSNPSRDSKSPQPTTPQDRPPSRSSDEMHSDDDADETPPASPTGPRAHSPSALRHEDTAVDESTGSDDEAPPAAERSRSPSPGVDDAEEIDETRAASHDDDEAAPTPASTSANASHSPAYTVVGRGRGKPRAQPTVLSRVPPSSNPFDALSTLSPSPATTTTEAAKVDSDDE